jgi:TDG/mug DNA glycosylase family protein
LYKPEEDSELLKLGLGLTNIVARPTRTAAEITQEEYEEGRLRLLEKIKRYHPKAVCFVGKGVYRQFSGRKDIEWGEQPDPVVKGTIEYVVPSTSGLVRMKTDEVAEIFRGLTKYAPFSKGGNAV